MQSICKEKKAGNDGGLRVISHLEKYYNVFVKDRNVRQLYELKHAFEDLKDTNEDFQRSLIENSDKLNEFKIKVKARDLANLKIVIVYF